MKQTLLFLLFLSIQALKAQNTYNIIFDTLETQTDIFKRNEQFLNEFKSSFNEKDSLMVVNFVKKYEAYNKWYEKMHYPPNTPEEFNLKSKEIENEQRKVMDYEVKINEADSVLKIELRKWVKDYVETKIRFYEKSKNIKVVFVDKIDNDINKIDFKEIISFINDSNWKSDYDYQYNFIKNKVLFDFKLE